MDERAQMEQELKDRAKSILNSVQELFNESYEEYSDLMEFANAVQAVKDELDMELQDALSIVVGYEHLKRALNK